MTRHERPSRPYGDGLDVMVHARFSAELAEELGRLASRWGVSVSEALRRLVEQATRLSHN